MRWIDLPTRSTILALFRWTILKFKLSDKQQKNKINNNKLCDHVRSFVSSTCAFVNSIYCQLSSFLMFILFNQNPIYSNAVFSHFDVSLVRMLFSGDINQINKLFLRRKLAQRNKDENCVLSNTDDDDARIEYAEDGQKGYEKWLSFLCVWMRAYACAPVTDCIVFLGN